MNYVKIIQTQQSLSAVDKNLTRQQRIVVIFILYKRYYSNYTKNTIIIIAVFHKKSFIELAYIRTIYLRKKHIHIL